MFNTDRNETTSIKMMSLAIIFLCLMTISSNAYPLSRSARQTVTNELATGLTNTGTSFQSWGGQTYLPQEEYSTLGALGAGSSAYRGKDGYSGYDGIGGYRGKDGYSNYDGVGNLRGKDGYSGGYDGVGGYGAFGGVNGINGYDRGDGVYDKNYGSQGWRGFGYGKNPYGAMPQSQYGLKY